MGGRTPVLATWHIRSKNGSFAVATLSVLISLLLKRRNSNRGRSKENYFPLQQATIKKLDSGAEFRSPLHMLQKHGMVRTKPGED
jgi:hypothetical protein